MQKNYSQNKIQDTNCLVSTRLKERRLMLEIDLKEISNLLESNVSKIQEYEKYADYLSNHKLSERIKPSNSPLRYFFKSPLTLINFLKKKIFNWLKFIIK